MQKRHITLPIPSPVEDPLEFDNFWGPPTQSVIRADAEEFARMFGLRPDLAEALGLRQYLREDTAKNLN